MCVRVCVCVRGGCVREVRGCVCEGGGGGCGVCVCVCGWCVAVHVCGV